MPKGTHLRRFHYRLVSRDEPVQMRDGQPYENTTACWKAMCVASKYARYLGFVGIDEFDDRRNPPPVIHVQEDALAGLEWAQPPELDVDIGEPPLPRIDAKAPQGGQGYMLEVWCEKSTMNDVLLPLCERYGANLVTGLGELSITMVDALVERITTAGKPVRIFYVSDFDPAGMSMPVAVARKVEWMIQHRGIKCDVKLFASILTAEQCARYRLPRTPIKESERRGKQFEDRFGSGATELDALEALHPGEFEKILSAELDRYFDHELAAEQAATLAEHSAELDEVCAQAIKRHGAELAPYLDEWHAIRSALTAWALRAGPTWQAVGADMADAASRLSDSWQWPQAAGGVEHINPLFDSSRRYDDQLAAYKKHQGK